VLTDDRPRAGLHANMIVKPDGTRHWPLTGYKQFRDIAPIRQYQFRQNTPDRIEVRLIAERPLFRNEESR
jgi:phenylacetate-CoA ligase